MSTELSISREQFYEWFPNDQELYELLTTEPESRADLIKYYLPSKLWRLNNLYTVIDKYGERVPFKMNVAQFKVYAYSLIHPRLIILKSRQQGVSTFWLLYFFDDSIFMSHLHVGLMAQGADEAASLLERVKFSWDNLNPEVKSFLERRNTKDNTKEYSFNNNSTIFIRTSFRSATLQRLHISEYGKICNASPLRAKETKTGTLQTIASGNPVVIESTAEGDNDYRNMWDKAWKQFESQQTFAGKDFYPLFLSWLDDPTCNEEVDQPPDDDALEYFESLEREGFKLTRTQKNFWIMQYRELEGDIYQEYPATPEEAFRAARDGTYWSKKYIELVVRRGHKVLDLWEPRLPVHATVDSGRHDYFVFTFWQVYDNQIRIIGEFWNTGEQLKYYCEYLHNEIPKGWDWKSGVVYLPHDFGVTDISQDDGVTREQVMHSHGVTNTHILDKMDLSDSIEAVRDEMHIIYIDEECRYIENCFLSYSKKYDHKLQMWTSEVQKSKWCHGADTIRYTVQAYQEYHYENDDDDTDDDNFYKGIAL